MYLFVEVLFYSGQRVHLPASGYRPDAVFAGRDDYWGITFPDLSGIEFDAPTLTIVRFTFQECHYGEVKPGQSFAIMEGPHQVGEGSVISIEYE